MTFTLMFTVLMTTSKESQDVVGNAAPLAIGLSVFAAHAVLIPLDGCSINPTRSLGPAVISGQWSGFWVFVLGPYAGSSLASIVYLLFRNVRGREKRMRANALFVHGNGQMSERSLDMKDSPSSETLAENMELGESESAVDRS